MSGDEGWTTPTDVWQTTVTTDEWIRENATTSTPWSNETTTMTQQTPVIAATSDGDVFAYTVMALIMARTQFPASPRSPQLVNSYPT